MFEDVLFQLLHVPGPGLSIVPIQTVFTFVATYHLLLRDPGEIFYKKNTIEVLVF